MNGCLCKECKFVDRPNQYIMTCTNKKLSRLAFLDADFGCVYGERKPVEPVKIEGMIVFDGDYTMLKLDNTSTILASTVQGRLGVSELAAGESRRVELTIYPPDVPQEPKILAEVVCEIWMPEDTNIDNAKISIGNKPGSGINNLAQTVRGVVPGGYYPARLQILEAKE